MKINLKLKKCVIPDQFSHFRKTFILRMHLLKVNSRRPSTTEIYRPVFVQCSPSNGMQLFLNTADCGNFYDSGSKTRVLTECPK